MKRASILLPFILFISLSEALSMEIRDTVWTAAKDRLVISYETRRDNGRISLRFLNIQKKLGRENSREYRKLDEISVLFFDRTGNYPDITFSNMVPEAFMVPAVMEYRKSDEGYFFLRDNPELVFTDTDRNDSFVLSIPLYLAHYEGRGRYVLFARADDLKIKIAKESVPHADPGNQYGQQTSRRHPSWRKRGMKQRRKPSRASKRSPCCWKPSNRCRFRTDCNTRSSNCGACRTEQRIRKFQPGFAKRLRPARSERKNCEQPSPMQH